MWKVSFYDSVATIVPGTLVLALLWGRFPSTPLVLMQSMPESVQFMTFVVAAFSAGQFCQVVGQVLRPILWPFGYPTDWPFRRHQEARQELTQLVLHMAKHPEPQALAEWRSAIQTAKTMLTANRAESRLDMLYAYCRMFQNLLVAAVGLLVFFILQENPLWYLIVPAIVLCWLGMRSYAKHYAREFFAAVRAWPLRRRSAFDPGTGNPETLLELEGAEPPLGAAAPFDGFSHAPRRRAVVADRHVAA